MFSYRFFTPISFGERGDATLANQQRLIADLAAVRAEIVAHRAEVAADQNDEEILAVLDDEDIVIT